MALGDITMQDDKYGLKETLCSECNGLTGVIDPDCDYCNGEGKAFRMIAPPDEMRDAFNNIMSQIKQRLRPN